MHESERYTGALAELITIYRKMKKGREAQNIYKFRRHGEMEERGNYVSETVPSEPKIRRSEREEMHYQTIFNFCTLNLHNLTTEKYLFYSKEAGLLQSQMFEKLSPNLNEIFQTNFFWLNVFNPSDFDLQAISSMFDVHDLTVLDIKEGNTDEKIEVFKHYTFISMRLLSENSLDISEDMDFNILIFKNFVLTFHDKPWMGIQDILNFIALLARYTALSPDWVLYSIVIEFLQDIKYIADKSSMDIHRIQELSKGFTGAEMSDILRSNFSMSCQLSSLSGFTKSKLEILAALRNRCRKRIVPAVQRYLAESLDDLKDVLRRIGEYNRVLERAQDTYLALINVAQTQEGNEMNKAMSRMSIATLIISPCQLVSGLWGMNVPVPYGGSKTLLPFFVITLLSILPLFIYYGMSTFSRMRRKRPVHRRARYNGLLYDRKSRQP